MSNVLGVVLVFVTVAFLGNYETPNAAKWIEVTPYVLILLLEI